MIYSVLLNKQIRKRSTTVSNAKFWGNVMKSDRSLKTCILVAPINKYVLPCVYVKERILWHHLFNNVLFAKLKCIVWRFN